MRELLSQVELLEAACQRARQSPESPAERDAVALALSGYVLSSNDLRRIARPYITGLANMVRAHADNLAYALRTAPDDGKSDRLVHGSLEQLCKSLSDLREALQGLERTGNLD